MAIVAAIVLALVVTIVAPMKIVLNGTSVNAHLVFYITCILSLGALLVQMELKERGHIVRMKFFGARIYQKESKRGEEEPPSLEKVPTLLPEMPELLTHIGRLLSAVKRSIKVKNVDVDARVGLGDPASTGLLYATCCSLGGFATSLTPDQCHVEITPDFTGERFEGKVNVELRLLHVKLLVPLMRLLLSKAFRKVAAG